MANREASRVSPRRTGRTPARAALAWLRFAVLLLPVAWLAMGAARTMRYDQAIAQAEDGSDTQAATAALRRAVALRPDLSAGWRRLASTVLADNPRQARVFGLRAIHDDSRDWRNWQTLGMIDLELGRTAAAQADLRRAVAANAGFTSHFQLANLAWVLGDSQEFWAQMRDAMRVAAPAEQAQTVQACLRLAPGQTGRLESIIPYSRASMSIAAAQVLASRHLYAPALRVLRKSACRRQLWSCRLATLQIVGEAVHAVQTGAAVTGFVAQAGAVWNAAVKAGALDQSLARVGAVADGSFQHAWRGPAFSWAGGQSRSEVEPGPTLSSHAAVVAMNGSEPDTVTLLSQLVEVQPGSRYALRFTAMATGVGAVGFHLVVRAAPAAGHELADIAFAPTRAWQRFSGQFRVPAGVSLVTVSFRYVRPFAAVPMSGDLGISQVAMRAGD